MLRVGGAAAVVVTLALGALLVPVTWAPLLVVAITGVVGVWLGQSIAREPAVRAAFTKAQSADLDSDLASVLEQAGERHKRSWTGKTTQEQVERSPVGQLLASLAALIRFGWQRHRRATVMVLAVLAGYLAVQFSQLPALVAARGALGVLAFTTAAVALVSLYTDNE